MKRDFLDKLSDFSAKVESDSKQETENEYNLKVLDAEERENAEQKQQEQIEFVERWIRLLSGKTAFSLAQSDIKNNLPSLYVAFQEIEQIQQEKKQRDINENAKKVSIDGEDYCWDEDIVLEAQIRRPFCVKAKEILEDYEENIIPQIEDLESFNDYYFYKIDSIMLTISELYCDFLAEFDIEDEDIDTVLEQNKNRWMMRDYGSVGPLYAKIEEAVEAAGIKINRQYEYDNSYEPRVYNGPGLLNAIDAKYQSEMVGVGFNFIRMIGGNLSKAMAVTRVRRVVDEVYEQLSKMVKETGRLICMWIDDVIDDAICVLKQREIINISRISNSHVENIMGYISRVCQDTNDSNCINDEQYASITKYIFTLDPFYVQNIVEDEFLSRFEALCYLNVDYIYIAEFNKSIEDDMSASKNEITKLLNVEAEADVVIYQNILHKFELISKVEYNARIKHDLLTFMPEFEALLNKLIAKEKEQNRVKDAYSANTIYDRYKEDVDLEKEISEIDQALRVDDLNYVWSKIEEGFACAEYKMDRYYRDKCRPAIENYDLKELNNKTVGLRKRMYDPNTLVNTAASYIYYYLRYEMYETRRRAPSRENEYAHLILELADKGNIYAIFQKGFWGTHGYYEATTKKEEGIRYLELAAKKQQPAALAWLGSYYRTGEVVGKIDLEKARFYLEAGVACGHPYAIKELKRLNDGSTASSSSCFITTATCLSLGKGDNCVELNAFRRFRDTWLIKQPDGKLLIDAYYATAPQIVQNINMLPSANEIYNRIWDVYLSKCLKYIEQKNYCSCKDLYIKMVEELTKKYK